jgi:protein O-mannosyl-transferase
MNVSITDSTSPAVTSVRGTSAGALAAVRRGPYWVFAVALVGLVLASYAPVVRDDFIWDDDAYVTQNGTLRSLGGLWSIWFVPFSIPQYYPLVHSTFWIEYHLWGLAPLGYHVVNVLLHAGSVILFWRLLVRLEVPGAWLAAAIFAVHPVEVESVAWITERKNVLSLVFALASMLSFLRFAPAEQTTVEPDLDPDRLRWPWYALSFMLFVAALLSKTVVATMPAVMVVVYWWKRGGVPLRELAALVPFFVLGAAMGLFTAWLEVKHVGADGEEWAFTPQERVLIAGRALWFYASKLVWPNPLIFFYRRWTIDGHVIWQYLYPLAALATIVVLWMARKRIGRGPLAAVLIFAGVLMPALGFLNVYPFRYSFVADHFQYHACLALVALAAAAVTTASTLLRSRGQMGMRLILGMVLLALGSLTFRQTRVYENLEVLYRDTMAQNPAGVVAYSNLAVYLDRIGRHGEALGLAREAVERGPNEPGVHNNVAAILMGQCNREGVQQDKLQESIDELNAALRISPNFTAAHSNLALALIEAKRSDEAIEHISRALELNPRDTRSLYVKAAMLVSLGKTEEAQEFYRLALARNPDYVEAHYGLGLQLSEHGHVEEAIQHWETALRVDPRCTDAHYALGSAMFDRGDLGGAAAHFRAAAALRPHYTAALVKLGMSLLDLGDAQGAANSFRDALGAAPENSDARLGLAMSLSRLRKAAEAAEEFRATLQLDPNRAQAHFEYANLLVAQDDLTQAVNHYSEAIRLQPEYFEAMQNLGAALLTLNDVDRAIGYLNDSLRLQPNNPQARANLEYAQKLKGNGKPQ